MSLTHELCFSLVLLFTLSLGVSAAPRAGDQEQAADWVARFAFIPPTVDAKGLCSQGDRELPRFAVLPSDSGRQLVRVALPFSQRAFPAELGLVVQANGEEIIPDVRSLTHHSGQPASVRRAIITFPYDFPDKNEREFHLALKPREAADSKKTPSSGDFTGRIGDIELHVTASSVEVMREDKETWHADLIAPPRKWTVAPTVEIIEQGQHYLWVRLLVPDAVWPRIIEVRADSLGTLAVRAHLQRLEEKDGHTPDFGWKIRGPRLEHMRSGEHQLALDKKPVEHGFNTGEGAWLAGKTERVSFPDAPLKRRGVLTAHNVSRRSEITYLRCRAGERVPHQEAAWREAAFVLGTSGAAPWNALLEPLHRVRIPAKYFDAIYESGTAVDLSTWSVLDDLRQYHRNATGESDLLGDDFGNVTGFPAGTFGMNRLNHCPPILMEYYRGGNPHLRDIAVQWCNNFYDLSIWWGTSREGEFGGTRYNNIQKHTEEHEGDTSFMWRSNTAVHFCTKGYDSFFVAYEETGDPRMATALRWQIEYAKRMVHTDRGECRNIGDVADFVRLHRFTGDSAYLDEALRLFRELRTRLSEGNLFSQGGAPIEKDPPFIDDDKTGYKHPFAKPYIIGYALAGLPELAHYFPDEPKLHDVIRAAADFLADSQDPAGGWRYPHPQSSRVLASQGMEHAAQLMRAAEFLESRGEPIGNLLDAIERVLQARILVWEKTGEFFSGLGGWEQAAGILKDGKSIYDFYEKPEDRDASRDYAEGSIGLGGSSPEGIVYFSEVLNFYLAHRPAERLFNANPELAALLKRMDQRRASSRTSSSETQYTRYGMADKLPAFSDAQVKRLTFPVAYNPEDKMDFAEWRAAARAKLLESLLTPPPRANFQAVVLSRQDRGSYEARKILFSVSADCRIPAYLLVPKGKGPFPAIIALHDHGAHFSIGKEKVVRPFDEREEVLADAEQWVRQNYGGRFVGDELAKRGYVVFATDALFWGDRGRREGVDYNAQQELASNLFQLGMCWAGVITWDDIRSAEFVASLPEVDPERIAAIGLSMGAHRTWTLCAATDRIAAGVAVCWMGTTKSLMTPGNNQTKGYSAYSMILPNIRNFLDYADVASIACPKPMLFFNGEQDGLFPVAGVEDSYAGMRRMWDSQGVGDGLVTKLWRVGHVFDQAMQEEAFSWLDSHLRRIKE